MKLKDSFKIFKICTNCRHVKLRRIFLELCNFFCVAFQFGIPFCQELKYFSLNTLQFVGDFSSFALVLVTHGIRRYR